MVVLPKKVNGARSSDTVNPTPSDTKVGARSRAPVVSTWSIRSRQSGAGGAGWNASVEVSRKPSAGIDFDAATMALHDGLHGGAGKPVSSAEPHSGRTMAGGEVVVEKFIHTCASARSASTVSARMTTSSKRAGYRG